MDIAKGTRFSKIIGEFGEAFVCNWLSRSGFEVAIVDHTGLDIVAYHPPTKRRIGITVKSRTRDVKMEAESVNIFSYQKDPTDRTKLLKACAAFACEPWLAVYVETSRSADLYLTSLNHYDQTYRPNHSRAIDTWKMGTTDKQAYDADPNVQHIHVVFNETNWDWQERPETNAR
jgi:Holliday junction resolvase-like predicted endonuclease